MSERHMIALRTKRPSFIPGLASRQRLEQQKVTLELSDSAKELIAREGYDPVYGARPLRRTIQKEILNPLSIDILEGKVREGQTVHVNAKDGALEFRAK